MFELFKFELFNMDVSSWFDSIGIGWGIGLVALALIGIYFTMRKEKETAKNTNAEGKVRNPATGEQKQLAVSRIRKAMSSKHQREISENEAWEFLEDLLFYHIIDNLIYGSEEMLYSNMEQYIPEDIGMNNETISAPVEPVAETVDAPPEIQEAYVPEPESSHSAPELSYDSSSSSDSGSDSGGDD